MKDKLKAIWRIFRSKSYFYTVHIENRWVSSYEIGNQPKGLRPAEERVRIMLNESGCVALATIIAAKKMVKSYHGYDWTDESLKKIEI